MLDLDHNFETLWRHELFLHPSPTLIIFHSSPHFLYLSVWHAQTAVPIQLATDAFVDRHTVSLPPLALYLVHQLFSHCYFQSIAFFSSFNGSFTSSRFPARFMYVLQFFTHVYFPSSSNLLWANFLFSTCLLSLMVPSPHSIVADFLCTRPYFLLLPNSGQNRT